MNDIEDKPYSRPKDYETFNNCFILKGMFNAIYETD
jgi:hypothetical protein